MADSHYYLVNVIIAKCAPSADIDMDSLVSDCSVGLLKAARRFNVDSGVKFKTFAWTWIHGALRMNLRDHSRRKERTVYIGQELENSPVPSDVETVDDRDEIEKLMKCLNDNERRIIDLIVLNSYGVQETAKNCGMSRFLVKEMYDTAIK